MADEAAKREEEYMEKLMAQKNKKFSSNVFGGGLEQARQSGGQTGQVIKQPNSAIFAKPTPGPTHPNASPTFQRQPGSPRQPASPRYNNSSSPVSPRSQPVNRPPPEIVNRPAQGACASGCGFSNPPSAKFCCGCGGPIAAASTGGCRSCGTFNPPGSKFCAGCGEILTGSQSLNWGSPVVQPQIDTTSIAFSIGNEVDDDELVRREEERVMKKLANTGVTLK